MTPSNQAATPGHGREVPPVFLIGYRGTGKSTVGLMVARELDVPFLDTDRMVEEAVGVTIAECFARLGEKVFRQRETRALRETLRGGSRRGGPVVATGGGIVLSPENAETMCSAGRVVWLTASPDEIRLRLSSDTHSTDSRPSLTGRPVLDEVDEVLRSREPLYRSAAHVEISTEKLDPGSVADRVARWLKSPGPVADSKMC